MSKRKRPTPSDPHLPYVQKLTKKNDWSGLVRYWLAHQYKPALQLAIKTLRRLSSQRGRQRPYQLLIQFLAEFAEDPFEPREFPRELKAGIWPEKERLTLYMLAFFPLIALCELAGQLPTERQDQGYQIGIEVAQKLRQVATVIDDQPLVAFIAWLLARSLRERHDLEAACNAYQEALKVYRKLARRRPDIYLSYIALTLNNLGNVRSDLSELEAARDAYQEGLEIYRELARLRPNAYRSDVAMTLNNLGNVRRDLNELEAARNAHEEALEICRELARLQPDIYRQNVAGCLNNFGSVSFDLNDLKIASNAIQESLEIFRELACLRPDVYRSKVALTLNSLGTIRHDLNELEAAQDAYQEALEIYRELARLRSDVYRPDVAMTLNKLGNVRRDFNELEAARDTYEQAISLHEEEATRQPKAHLQERIHAYINLAEIVGQRWPMWEGTDWDRARECLRAAKRCVEQLRHLFHDNRQRQRIQEEYISVYDQLVQLCVAIWEQRNDVEALAEACETAEASRSRAIVEMLADETLSPRDTPAHLADEFRQLRRSLQQAKRRLQDEEAAQPAPEPPTSNDDGEEKGTRATTRGARSPELAMELGKLTRSEDRIQHLRRAIEQLNPQYEQALQQIRAHDPEFNPDQPVPPVTLTEIQQIVPQDIPTAFIQFTTTPQESLAQIITHDGTSAVRLPNLPQGAANEMLMAWLNDYYHDCRTEKGRLDFPRWNAAMIGHLEKLATATLRPILEKLPSGIQRLVIVPHRSLHLFPFHACRQANGRYVADDFEVGYSPSLSILLRCTRRPEHGREKLLTIDTMETELLSDIELHQVSRRFPDVTTVKLNAEIKSQVLAQSHPSEVWHYPGHAHFNPSDPLSSALHFGPQAMQERWLTLRDVFCGLHIPNAWIAVLSACETGMTWPSQLDELIGFPTGFLYAGAKCVVNSLWLADDLSTLLTMDRFYQEWRSGKAVGAALREAQRWLREDLSSGQKLKDYVASTEFKQSLTDPKLQRIMEVKAMWIARDAGDAAPFAGPAWWSTFTATGLSFSLAK